MVDLHSRRLAGLRGCFAGRRGFLIGNGPSLRAADLERLHDHGEVTIACNKIHLIFPQTRWRPTVCVIEDQGVARSCSREIGENFAGNVLYADYLEPHIPGSARYAAFRLRDRVAPPQLPGFSLDFASGAVCGGTVAYTALQLAHWLGLTEIYLLGVDFNYALPGLRPSAEFPGFQTYTPGAERNYFAAGYVPDGAAHIAPDLESSRCAFAAAQRQAAADGRFRILNATRGGKLEVFPRVDFDDLFPRPPREPRETPVLPPDDPAHELTELVEAAFTQDLGRLRSYSFIDRLGEARITASRADDRATVGTARIEGREARTLFLHPPMHAFYQVPVGNTGILSLAVALHPDVWANPETGPCRFLTEVDGTVVSDLTIDVRGDPAACRWFWVHVPVEASASGRHGFAFRTEGVGGSAFRWAVWRSPRFVWAADAPGLQVEFRPAAAGRDG